MQKRQPDLSPIYCVGVKHACNPSVLPPECVGRYYVPGGEEDGEGVVVLPDEGGKGQNALIYNMSSLSSYNTHSL